MLLKGIPEVQGSNRPVSAGEMVLIRIAHAADLPTLDEALKSLGDGPQATVPVAPRGGASPQAPSGPGNGASAVAQARMPSGPGGGQTMRLVEAAPNPAQVPAPQPVPQPEAAPAVPVKSLADIAALADANRDLFFKTQFKHCVRLVRIEPGRLEISLTAGCAKDVVGRPDGAVAEMDRPALDRFGLARRGRADAGRDGNEQARERLSRRASPILLSQRSLRDFPAPKSSMCAFPMRRKRRPKMPTC